MNPNVHRFAAGIVATLAAVSLAQQREEPVKVNVEKLRPYLRVQIEAHAKEGITVLREYLERTRSIHRVRLEDVLVVEEAPAGIAKTAKEEGKVAEATAPAKK